MDPFACPDATVGTMPVPNPPCTVMGAPMACANSKVAVIVGGEFPTAVTVTVSLHGLALVQPRAGLALVPPPTTIFSF